MDHEQVSGKTRTLFAHMLTCSPLLNWWTMSLSWYFLKDGHAFAPGPLHLASHLMLRMSLLLSNKNVLQRVQSLRWLTSYIPWIYLLLTNQFSILSKVFVLWDRSAKSCLTSCQWTSGLLSTPMETWTHRSKFTVVETKDHVSLVPVLNHSCRPSDSEVKCDILSQQIHFWGCIEPGERLCEVLWALRCLLVLRPTSKSLRGIQVTGAPESTLSWTRL